MYKKLLVFSLLYFLTTPLLCAESVQVSAALDKRSVQINEEIRLTLRVSGSNSNIQAPRLPAFEGFETYYTGRASHLTFINNQSATKVEFNYILLPKAAGQFTLSPIMVNVDTQTFQTEPIRIEVLGDQGMTTRTAPAPPAQTASVSQPPYIQEPSPQEARDDENIFVRAWVDKSEAYPNEQILLTYSLYTRYDTRYEGFSEEPEMSGFWIEEFPMERDIKRETVRMNGKRYVKADIRKIALYPTATAQYTINPGIIKVSVRQEPQSHSIFDEFFSDSFFSGSGFFSRRETRILKPDPIQVTVKAFPDVGKPDSYQGAVGVFQMSAALDKDRVKQNEPLTMNVVIEGEGNIDTLKRPALPELDEFKIYEADSSTQLFKTGGVIGGKKNFEIVFIPTKSGDFKIPRLEFSFFNPVQKKYMELKTPEFKISVEPSAKPFEIPKNLSRQEIFKKEIQVESKDIHFIQERLGSKGAKAASDIAFYLLIGVNGLLTIFFLGTLFHVQQERVFSKDTALKRRLFAKSGAGTRIKNLRKNLMKSSDANVYFEEVDKILTQYLSDKFDLSAYGTTRFDIEKELEETLGSHDPLYQSVLEVYRICDESRFGKQELPKQLKEDAIKILKQTISRLEKIKRKQ